MRGIKYIIGLVLVSLLSLVALVGFVLLPVYLLLVFFGAEGRAAALKAKLQSTLMRDETAVADAVEFRPYALLRRRLGLAVTTSRVILLQRKLLGGFTMQDFQWKDLTDVRIDENILPGLFGSSLVFEFAGAGPGNLLMIEGIDSALASQIYNVAQGQEQAWEEKRRIRDLEEKRAVAGGFSLQPPAYGGPPPAEGLSPDGQPSTSVLNEINEAKALFDAGAITDAEFQEIKSKILSRHFR